MKSFKVHIKEKIVPFSAFVLPRSQMPQIKNTDHFINYIEQLGINTTNFISSVTAINPTQFEYDKWKVNNIKMDWRKDPDSIQTSKPILISDDNFVLDGHHRYFAALQSNNEIPIIQIDLPINKLLKLTLDYRDLHG